MTSLRCLVFGHDWMRQWAPGHVCLRCQVCGVESPGLRGPVSTAVPPVVKVRRPRRTKPAEATAITSNVLTLKKRRSA